MLNSDAELYICPVRRRYLWQLWRYGAFLKHFEKHLEVYAKTELAKTELAEIELNLLRAVLRDAEEQTLYYPRSFAAAGVHWRDLQGMHDLRFFPLVSRAELQSHYLEFFSSRVRRHDIEEGWLGQTSGSTGEPVRFFMNGESIHAFTGVLRYLWRRYRLGSLPRLGRTGIVLLCTLPRSSIYQVLLPLFGFSRFRKLHWAEPSSHRTLSRLQPSVITGDPDSLSVLADAQESGRVHVQPKLILSSAFALPTTLANRLRQLTKSVVIDYYSMAETGPLAIRCEAETWHVLRGACVLENEGDEIVVTNLRNPLFPLIRYRTGDLGRLHWLEAACGCGLSGQIISSFEGRIRAQFVSVSGARVDPSQVQPLLARLPAKQFQLVQESIDCVRLRHYSKDFLPREDIYFVSRALSRLIGCSITLKEERTDTPLYRSGEKPIVYLSRVTDP